MTELKVSFTAHTQVSPAALQKVLMGLEKSGKVSLSGLVIRQKTNRGRRNVNDGIVTHWLAEHGPASAKVIAEGVELPAGSVYLALNRLADAGTVFASKAAGGNVWGLTND